MLIVAIAWIYVVGLMALTEPTVVAGIVTFLFYCVLPLGIVMYIAGSKGRRRRAERAQQEQRERQRQAATQAATVTDATSTGQQAD